MILFVSIMSIVIVNKMYLIYIIEWIYMEGFWGLIASVPSLVHSLHKKAKQKQATVGLSVGLSG